MSRTGKLHQSLFFCQSICTIKPFDLNLRYKNKGYRAVERHYRPPEDIEILPHQSWLGNSSIISEIPRQTRRAMAGPDVHFIWRMPVKCLHTGQADYKVRRELKTCLSEFHRILWYDPLYSPTFIESGFFSVKFDVVDKNSSLIPRIFYWTIKMLE